MGLAKKWKNNHMDLIVYLEERNISILCGNDIEKRPLRKDIVIKMMEIVDSKEFVDIQGDSVSLE